MEKWEYRTVLAKEVGVHLFNVRKSARRIDEFFNDLGRQGWEVLQVNFDTIGGSGPLAFLKRRRT